MNPSEPQWNKCKAEREGNRKNNTEQQDTGPF